MAHYTRLGKGHTDRNYTILNNCVHRYLERQRQDKAKADRARSAGNMPVAGNNDAEGGDTVCANIGRTGPPTGGHSLGVAPAVRAMHD